MMNYKKAIELAQKGFIIRRLDWDIEGLAWWHVTGIMKHNQPFDSRQENESSKSYDYILTPEDAQAEDWVVL